MNLSVAISLIGIFLLGKQIHIFYLNSIYCQFANFQGIVRLGETKSVKGKSVLDETFDEFKQENNIVVQSGEEDDDERAAFEESREHARKNNANPNSTHTETLYAGISELKIEQFEKTHLGVKPGVNRIIFQN